MKFEHVHPKTTHIPFNGKIIQVSGLPKEIINEIQTLDRLLQDKIDCLYELEKVEIAALLKTSQIHQLLLSHFKEDAPNTATEATANQEELERVTVLKAGIEKLKKDYEKTGSKKK